MTRLKPLVICSLAVLLSGCLVPERFTAAIKIDPDASYSYSYKGTAVHALAAAQIKKGKPLSSKEESGLKAEADKMSKLPDVTRATYVNEGRYKLELEGKKQPGERLKLLGFFEVSTASDGVITITSPDMKPRDLQGLQQLGIKIDGTLEVKLPKNAEIISQNATSMPTFFGMWGAYTWKIGRLEQRPVMRIRLKK